jgi:hypothetical protein
MLRTAVIVVGAALVCAGILLVMRGIFAPGWQAVGIGVVVLLGTLFERWRYQRSDQTSGGPWVNTGERFLDPSSGDEVEVLFNPRSGERRYVPRKPQGPASPPP